jgi:hypothetical protein
MRQDKEKDKLELAEGLSRLGRSENVGFRRLSHDVVRPLSL